MPRELVVGNGGDKHRRQSGSDLRCGCCGRSLAVALGVELEDGGVMDEAVDRGDGDRRIGKDLPPFREGLIAGDDEGAPFVALGDELEQDRGLGLILADIAEVVEDEAVEPIEFGEQPR